MPLLNDEDSYNMWICSVCEWDVIQSCYLLVFGVFQAVCVPTSCCILPCCGSSSVRCALSDSLYLLRQAIQMFHPVCGWLDH